jgi:hypothetical protein
VLKTVHLKLKDFPTIPPTLQGAGGTAKPALDIDLADLFHHYYLDGRGVSPPDPDPVHFEHVRYLLPCPDFRFQRDGLGVAGNTNARISNSTQLGQAFCRWFLDAHLTMPYVAHINTVRDHGALKQFGGISVETDHTVTGNGPDYFCVTPANAVCLAEAKGTVDPVGFGTKQFKAWRDQFKRVVVKDPAGVPLTVKGYITAMRWAMEHDSPKIVTTLSAEDPETEGRRPLGPDDRNGLALAVKSIHYANSLRRMRQPLMSAALLRGLTLPEELRINAWVWKCVFPGYEKFHFVGGFFPGTDGATPQYQVTADGKTIVHNPPSPFRLDIASGTFFGLEEKIFHTLAGAARGGPGALFQLRPAPRAESYFSGLSFLQDGHVLGPIEFFQPVAPISL